MVIISRRRDKSFRGFRIGAKGTSVVLAPRHLGAHAMHVRLGVGVFPYVVIGVEEDVRFVIRHPLHVRPRYVAPVGDVDGVGLRGPRDRRQGRAYRGRTPPRRPPRRGPSRLRRGACPSHRSSRPAVSALSPSPTCPRPGASGMSPTGIFPAMLVTSLSFAKLYGGSSVTRQRGPAGGSGDGRHRPALLLVSKLTITHWMR